MASSIPKPAFDSCDETSLKVKWPAFSISENRGLFLQYKEIHEGWTDARSISIPSSGEVTTRISSFSIPKDQQTVTLTAADVVDLKPGTPYYLRLAVESSSGELLCGPETVFDTKPIDCTPKSKKCILS